MEPKSTGSNTRTSIGRELKMVWSGMLMLFLGISWTISGTLSIQNQDYCIWLTLHGTLSPS
ncbi:MAG: hypothetical protein KGL39_08870 [Patescibacteria group bacterium]|nr:hypothetical protein [Patescibacteria group bacterium]